VRTDPALHPTRPGGIDCLVTGRNKGGKPIGSAADPSQHLTQTRQRLATTLIERRMALGMSQYELAAVSGVARSTIQSTEQGRSCPHLEVAEQLLAAVGVEIHMETTREEDDMGRREPRAKARQVQECLSPELHAIGRIVSEERVKQNISQPALAWEAGVALQTVQVIERAHTGYSIRSLLAVLAALGLELEIMDAS